MSKVIMVQGTMSNVGKSFIVAGLCRIMKQDGYRVAPFKSQNMALNSYITDEGLEMGRAQVMQAEAAGIKPMVCMNPVLLKPVSHIGSQVIVNGEVLGNMCARDYFAYKKELIPDIKRAFKRLEEHADIIVIEGAGSPAEINLKENDIVNMGLAALVDAPVLLVGDIDRGGVFAQLLGTLMLLTDEERDRVKGLIINKFRGDKSILEPGAAMLEELGNVPVTGVVPYMELSLEDEDSLSGRFDRREMGVIDIAVIRYPRISNFTDFNVFEQMDGVTVRYVTKASQLESPDMIILPGSKNTMGDLKWMRECGLEAAVKKLAIDTPVFGICGGFQMLGRLISDDENVEEGGSMRGMELLDVITQLKKDKVRRQTKGKLPKLPGMFSGLSGLDYEGYEIHMGQTVRVPDETAGGEGYEIHMGQTVRVPDETVDGQSVIDKDEVGRGHDASVIVSGANPNVYGTYVHGIFDKAKIAAGVVSTLAARKGVYIDDNALEDYKSFKEKQYDKLADILRKHLNMEDIYGMLREARLD